LRFEVWAPGHERVDLELQGPLAGPLGGPLAGALGGPEAFLPAKVPMEKSSRGWFFREVGEAGPGTRYHFSLDGGPPRPDPRSAWQPLGIDGPSAVVDHQDFAWHDAGWRGFDLASAVLYELHAGTFSEEGTFEGAIGHLGHLASLGINAVELMPVAEGSGDRGWGYDGADLWAPHHAYGGPEGLKRLVDACHSHGIAVVLDVVYNHLGPAGNYLGEFGPYFTDAYQTPWGAAVNFDGPGSYGVRDFVVANALMWLRDYHADGLRLDAVHAVHDEGAVHIVEELSAAVDALAGELGRKLWVIAESDRNDPRVARSRPQHGWGATACWDDDFHHALHALLTGESSGYYVDFGRVGQLAKAFRDGYVYDGQFSEFRQRRHGRPADGLPDSAFVVFLQDHDQVGNRALGERLSHLVGTDLLMVGAALLLLSPFVPMLFQGEEWGATAPFLYFTDHRARELGRAVTEGRRREHQVAAGVEVPDPQDPSTFERSKLDWSELAREPHASLLEWYRRLIALRRSVPELSCGDSPGRAGGSAVCAGSAGPAGWAGPAASLGSAGPVASAAQGGGLPGVAGGNRRPVSTDFSEEGRWLVVRRGSYSIAANFAGEDHSVPLSAGGGTAVLSSHPRARVEGGVASVPARSVVVVAH
jgi:maltooligosyltrehalose trehalohydrolase